MEGGFSTTKEEVSPTGERIIIDAEGNRVIAATRRPDGTLRKEIRIRKGYFREEEKQHFKTKGTDFRERIQEKVNIPIGFLPLDASTSSEPSSKPALKKKKKKSENSLDNIPPPVIETFTPFCKQTNVLALDSPKLSLAGNNSVSHPKAKEGSNLTNRLRNVKKRIGEIEELEKKQVAGEAITIEQLKKIQRKKQIEKEILQLEETLGLESNLADRS